VRLASLVLCRTCLSVYRCCLSINYNWFLVQSSTACSSTSPSRRFTATSSLNASCYLSPNRSSSSSSSSFTVLKIIVKTQLYKAVTTDLFRGCFAVSSPSGWDDISSHQTRSLSSEYTKLPLRQAHFVGVIVSVKRNLEIETNGCAWPLKFCVIILLPFISRGGVF